jgi:CBS domain-containing protein
VTDLVRKELLPLAYTGLEKAGVAREDREYFLTVIEQRLGKKTGSQWCIRNYRDLKKSHKKDDALLMLTKAIYTNQQAGLPVHEWPKVDPDLKANEASHLVSHIMSTELFTVNENDLADLATSVMLWKNIHHVPVENNKGQLSGLLTWTHMTKFREKAGSRVVKDIMVREVITVQPENGIDTAIKLMRQHKIGCLPVVQDHHLVGIITHKDLIPFEHGESV